MNYSISFMERAEVAREALSKQRFITLEEASIAPERNEYPKEQETKELIEYIDQNNLWYSKEIVGDSKIGEGTEQKVYFDPATQTVIKLNDVCIYLLG